MAPELYQPIYLLIISILTFVVCHKYSELYIDNVRMPIYSQALYAGMLAIFMILFIGLRPIRGHFVDMWNYKVNYMMFNYGKPFKFTWETDNFLFDNFMAWLGANHVAIEWFFLLVAAFYFGLLYLACRKLFPNDTLLSFLVYLGAFSTFSYGTNGIKAGAAASIFLVALAYKDNLKVCIPLLWVSLGFHHSMLAPVVAFAIAFFYRKPKYYLYGWLFCLLLAAAHVTYFMEYFSGFTDDHGAKYLNTNVKNTVLYVSGFRPDFILYSAVPIFLGYYYIQKEKIISDTYNFLWCVYTITNCVFLLCTYGTFINRIAYLSWLMLPFVLLYPVLYCEEDAFQLRNLSYVVYGHLGFTLFMNVFYYGL